MAFDKLGVLISKDRATTQNVS